MGRRGRQGPSAARGPRRPRRPRRLGAALPGFERRLGAALPGFERRLGAALPGFEKNESCCIAGRGPAAPTPGGGGRRQRREGAGRACKEKALMGSSASCTSPCAKSRRSVLATCVGGAGSGAASRAGVQAQLRGQGLRRSFMGATPRARAARGAVYRGRRRVGASGRRGTWDEGKPACSRAAASPKRPVCGARSGPRRRGGGGGGRGGAKGGAGGVRWSPWTTGGSWPSTWACRPAPPPPPSY